MNNKGFTLVELLVTFALASVIIIMLLNVLVIIKKNFSDVSNRTKLVVNQATISNMLNSKFVDDNLDSVSGCDNGDYCYQFDFKDGTTIYVAVSNNSSYDDISIVTVNSNDETSEYLFNHNVPMDGVSIGTPQVINDSPYMIFKLPISHRSYPNYDFGINLVYKTG